MNLFKIQKETGLVFLSGVFLTSLIVGNIIGTTKFVTFLSFGLSEFWQNIFPDILIKDSRLIVSVPVGILAYPVTFLATDIITEVYGKDKAQRVIFVGFLMNLFLLAIMYFGHSLPNSDGISGANDTFEEVYRFMFANTTASMIAYLIAQTIDVELFHFWKRITNGRHLWIRNNCSTMISQLIDSIVVISIIYYAGNFGESVNSTGDLIALIISSYIFKFCFAIIDTPFVYFFVFLFKGGKIYSNGNKFDFLFGSDIRNKDRKKLTRNSQRRRRRFRFGQRRYDHYGRGRSRYGGFGGRRRRRRRY